MFTSTLDDFLSRGKSGEHVKVFGWSFIEKSSQPAGGSLRKDFELWGGIKSLIDLTSIHFPLYIEHTFSLSLDLLFQNAEHF